MERRKRQKQAIVNKLNEKLEVSENVEKQIMSLDITKLSPELREKIEDWDIQDIKKFLAWLKENKG